MTAAVGNFLLLLKHNWNIPSPIATNTAQALAQLAAYPTAGSGENGQAYGVLVAGSAPTSVEADVSPASDLGYMLALADGVTAQGGTARYDHLTPPVDPIEELFYDATVANSLIAMVVSHHPDTRILTATFSGGAGLVIEGWSPDMDLILGVHSGATGENVVAITTNVPSTEMRCTSLELVP